MGWLIIQIGNSILIPNCIEKPPPNPLKIIVLLVVIQVIWHVLLLVLFSFGKRIVFGLILIPSISGKNS